VPDLKIQVRNDPAGITAIPTGAPTSVSVPILVLVWHAIFTGGSLPAASTPMSRLMFRLSTLRAMQAALEIGPDGWRATELYRLIETSEKSGISYRIGTVMAGVAADLVLNIPLLTHRQALFGSSTGKRGDLVGRRTGTGDWHGLEAKGAGPYRHTGAPPVLSNDYHAAAKLQAQEIATDLITYGIPGGWTDHWACITQAATTQPLEIVLDDPPPEEGTPPRLPPEGSDFVQQDPEERLLQSFYQVVADIEDLLAPLEMVLEQRELSAYRGIRIPQSNLWIGAHQSLFAARREEHLVSTAPELDAHERDESDDIASRVGLAVASLGANVVS
jgi:hypothetical protein